MDVAISGSGNTLRKLVAQVRDNWSSVEGGKRLY